MRYWRLTPGATFRHLDTGLTPSGPALIIQKAVWGDVLFDMKTNNSSNLQVQTETSGEQPTNVLVPIDFSPESLAALRAAVSAAGRSNAHITLLNIVEQPLIYRGTEVPGSRRRLQESRGQQLEHLADVEVPASMTSDVIVGSGEPGYEINRIATQRNVDCIVLAEHQRHAWFGGDTARKVADAAPCKVIVLKGKDTTSSVPARIKL